MWSGIRNVLEKTYEHGAPFDRMVGIVLILILIVAIYFGVKRDPIFVDHQATWITIGVILYVMAIVPPVKRMTDQRHALIFYVATWGLISVIILCLAFYGLFFVLLPNAVDREKFDRILNIPPIFGALGIAGIGWYVHQELTAKLHRTSNSFALVMQTRTSTEFLKHTRSLYAIYPPPTDFPAEDAQYFETSKRIEIDRVARELTVALNPDQTKKGTYLKDLAKVEAIEGLKYLLNFYEFMAFGIHAGDLDETLLYETVSPSVVGWYIRSQSYCNNIRKTSANKLAYQHLHRLVEGYKTKIGNKEIEINGWNTRLKLEKATSTL